MAAAVMRSLQVWGHSACSPTIGAVWRRVVSLGLVVGFVFFRHDANAPAHERRHTCASWLDAVGVRPVIVSRLMGHAAPAR